MILFLKLHLLLLEVATGRGPWIWAGHLDISFQRTPGFGSRLIARRGERRGIRVSRFGPLVVTWPENS